MNRSIQMMFVAAIVAALGSAAVAVDIQTVPAGNLLVNPGFETIVATTGSWPTNVGYWRGDDSAIVTASDGILPLEGSHMLKFIYAASGRPSEFGACEVMQVLDLTAFASFISQGHGVAVASANFNRVHGDSQTDRAFGVELRAYAGDASTFPSQYQNGDELALDYDQISTDGDTSTWEAASIELSLPVTTGFVAVRIWASENVHNDLTGVEFDGHYADATSLVVIPEPATLGMLALGGLTLLGRRRSCER